MLVRKTTVSAGQTYLFTLPFWIYIDREVPPKVRELNRDGTTIRIYPPFRSAAANYFPLPAINPLCIPYTPTATRTTIPPYHFAPTVIIPLLTDGKGFPVLAIQTHEWDKPPRTFPMDSLRIDVLDPAVDLSVANDVVTRLLEALRCHSGQWWIGHSVAVFPGFLRQYFPVASDGSIQFQGESKRTARVRTVDGSEAVIDHELWNRAVADVSAGSEPALSALLLLDARYHGYAGDFRRGILDAAIACEQAKEAAFERTWRALHPGQLYKRGRVLKGYDLDMHLDRDLKKLCGRSYREEFPRHWSSVGHLWSTRGNVAHGEGVFYRSAGTRVHVGEPEFQNIVRAADHCVRWLQRLTAGEAAQCVTQRE